MCTHTLLCKTVLRAVSYTWCATQQKLDAFLKQVFGKKSLCPCKQSALYVLKDRRSSPKAKEVSKVFTVWEGRGLWLGVFRMPKNWRPSASETEHSNKPWAVHSNKPWAVHSNVEAISGRKHSTYLTQRRDKAATSSLCVRKGEQRCSEAQRKVLRGSWGWGGHVEWIERDDGSRVKRSHEILNQRLNGIDRNAAEEERGLSARHTAVKLRTPAFNCWLCDHGRIFFSCLNYSTVIWAFVSKGVFILFWYLLGKMQGRNTWWNHIFSKSLSEFENYAGKHTGTVLSLTVYLFHAKAIDCIYSVVLFYQAQSF